MLICSAADSTSIDCSKILVSAEKRSGTQSSAKPGSVVFTLRVYTNKTEQASELQRCR